MKDKQIDPLPDEFASYEEAVEFWDAHDTTDYLENFETVAVDAELKRRRFEVEVDEDLMEVLHAQAQQRGIAVNRLVSEMLREKIRAAQFLPWMAPNAIGGDAAIACPLIEKLWGSGDAFRRLISALHFAEILQDRLLNSWEKREVARECQTVEERQSCHAAETLELVADSFSVSNVQLEGVFDQLHESFARRQRSDFDIVDISDFFIRSKEIHSPYGNRVRTESESIIV